MKRHHFIAAILGLSIATSGFAAAPARADNDTAKVIAGIATLAIIGSAIAKSNNDHEYDGVTLHKAGYKTYGGHHYKKKHHKKKYGHKRYKKHYGHKSYKKGYGYRSYKKHGYYKKGYRSHRGKYFKPAYAY
ncbi:hypothetical protein ROA7450_01428 [Roseovarius albus]|uniref:Uncharacterized protein n=1 Tax=Roseovarius albus TaxID=1247867 RepID=A0A1X6YVD7_9RHOB|nr:hypothetical protein [Roseovarius albus]SLN31803.1 hypothetical protein ROA7450_01428 [Roseovarius albus]